MSSTSKVVQIQSRKARFGQNLVIQDLHRFGPQATESFVSLEQAQHYCKTLAQHHYENFSIASFLVPAAIRQDFYNIYAYCRWSDDLADELVSSDESIQLLIWWRDQLRECFTGSANHPVFVALRKTIDRHGLMIEPFEALLDAFAQDQQNVRYATDDALLRYCQGSANPVGRILLRLAQVDTTEALELSDEICTGLQIANFCQDLRLDALRGRIYLPQERWNRYPIDESQILDGTPSETLKNALRDWVFTAQTHLANGLPLVKLVPRWLARDVQLFARGGLTILDNIANAGFDVWSQPIEVTHRQKIALLFRSVLSPRSTRLFQFAHLSKPPCK